MSSQLSRASRASLPHSPLPARGLHSVSVSSLKQNLHALPQAERTAFIAAHKLTFARELEQLVLDIKASLPPDILAMRLSEFLHRESIHATSNNPPCAFAIRRPPSDLFHVPETPKTATRRSIRHSQRNFNDMYNESVLAGTPSRSRHPRASFSTLTTPNRTQVSPHTPLKFPPMTPFSFEPLATHPPSTTKRARLTIAKPQYHQAPQAIANPPYHPTQQASAQSRPSAAEPEIVQFQLNNGHVVDVDFSRSPQSALADANLLTSEAIGEVKAKIETYANQFMQYLKFFKKFKPQK